MGDARKYKEGDVIIHSRKPEWGEGVVRKAINRRSGDASSQKLVIDFSNHKRMTIDTAIAPLIAKETAMTMSATKSSTGGWLAELEKNVLGAAGDGIERLYAMPAECSDPFVSEEARLKATLDTYRFTTEPRALLDWAVAQTGHDDPLSHFTRQEMEQAFGRFAHNRDQHLKELVLQMKRTADGPQIIRKVNKACKLEAARNALQKAMRG